MENRTGKQCHESATRRNRLFLLAGWNAQERRIRCPNEFRAVAGAGVVSGAFLFRPDAIEGEASVTSSSDTLAPNPTRELAAIMFSDIVGYTAIMGRDEREGLRAVREHREHLRAVLPQFNGRLIGEIGDGTLSSFHSAVDAVNCARELQATLVEDPELRLRIGIHVGDVVFTDKTVLGDGVNIASRIHELAPPGGCCISERVYEEIRNKPEFHVKDLGEKHLKNVARPIRAYALTAADATGQPRSPLGLTQRQVNRSVARSCRWAWRDADRRDCRGISTWKWMALLPAGCLLAHASPGDAFHSRPSARESLGRSGAGVFRRRHDR